MLVFSMAKAPLSQQSEPTKAALNVGNYNTGGKYIDPTETIHVMY